MKIGYSYIRFSFSRQAKGDSVRRQEADRDLWCQRNGVTLDTSVTLQDFAVSAFTGKHRSNPDRYALATFLEMVQHGKVPKDAYLIIENLDRLSREHVRAATTLFLSILDGGVNIVTTTPEKVYRHDSKDMTDIIIAVMELSRGHSESQVKSERVKAAWGKRKTGVASKPIKELLPLWLDVKAGKVVERPERVQLVKRVFQLIIDGHGFGSIMRILNAEQVPVFKPRVKGHSLWQKSSLAKVVRNRAVLGELTVNGETLSLLPPIVDEADFYKAQNAIAARQGSGGRERSKARSLFTSLVIDANDGTRWSLANGGTGQGSDKKTYIENVAGQQKGAARTAIPYNLFETLILRYIREVAPADLLPPGDRKEGDRLAELADKKGKVENKMREIQREVDANPDITSLLTALVAQERKLKALTDEYESVKRELAAPVADGLTQTHTLIEMLDKAEDKEELRNRLRAKIANVVESIKVRYTAPEGRTFAPRLIGITIKFKMTWYSVVMEGTYTPGRYRHPEQLTFFVGGHKPLNA